MKRYKCKRCGHTWYPRKPAKPIVCPKCKSPYWNKKPSVDSSKNNGTKKGNESS